MTESEKTAWTEANNSLQNDIQYEFRKKVLEQVKGLPTENYNVSPEYLREVRENVLVAIN